MKCYNFLALLECLSRPIPQNNSFPIHHLAIRPVDYPHSPCYLWIRKGQFVPISEEQLAANRANAAKSTGPRTPEGKVAHLKADLTAVYQPVNSQELFALERMALTQQAMLRAARLESGLFTTCLDAALAGEGHPFTPMTPELAGNGDIEITRAQNRNYA